MWLADRRIEDLNAIKVDRALADILASDPEAREAPTACPVCLGDLLRTTLPKSDLFVSACPHQHGVWLSRAEGERLRELLAAQDAALARKRDRLRVVRRTLVAALAVARGAVVAGAVVAGRDEVRRHRASPAEDPDSRRITPANWPQRDWSAWYPLPSASSQIGDRDELRYIQDVLLALQKGADNRLNMHEVLRTTRTADEYETLLDVYQRRQAVVLAKLNGLAAPERLRAVHRDLVVATDRQIVFFGVLVAEKIKDSTVDLCRMLGHPALIASTRALHAAWDRIRMLYPNLDHATSDAIESRLCRFDVI